MSQLLRNLPIAIRNFVDRFLEETEKHGDRLVLVPIIIYIVAFSGYTCYMHYTFKTYAWDLGIMTQSLWTTLNSGKVLYSTLEVPYGNPSGNFLGVHFSPIMFLVLPVYALYQSPQTLLVFQSFILAIAALPLYWLARDKLGKKTYGLAFALAYLLNPALHGVNTFDFHVEIFTPIFMLLAFYFVEKGKWLKATPFLALELITVEFAPILVFFFGVYFFAKRISKRSTARPKALTVAKRLVGPIIIMIVSVSCLYLALWTIQMINPLKTGAPSGVWRYWGSSIFEVGGNIIRNPADVVTILVTPVEKPYFAIFLFASVLFLPLFAPVELLLSVPWLFVAFLSDYQPYYQPYFQYSAFVLGQLFIAAVYGFRRLFQSEKGISGRGTMQRKVIGTMLAVNVLLFLAISPVGIPAFTNRTVRPYAINFTSDTNHIVELHKLLDFIPSDASVAAIHNIFPHVAQRLHAYILKWPLDYEVDYIIVDVRSPTYTWSVYGQTPDQIIVNLMNSGKYGILASSDGAILFKKGYSSPPEYFTPQIDILKYDALVVNSGRILWDYSSSSTRIISTDSDNSLGYIWFGPYRFFAPGDYLVTFRMKTANETSRLLLDIAANQGKTVIAQRTLNGTEFRKLNEWEDFTISFTIDVPTKLEFRGYCFTDNTLAELDYIRVEQHSSP